MYVCVYVYVYTHNYICVCIYNVFVYLCIGIYIYIYIYIHIHTYIHTYIHAYIHICIIDYNRIYYNRRCHGCRRLWNAVSPHAWARRGGAVFDVITYSLYKDVCYKMTCIYR